QLAKRARCGGRIREEARLWRRRRQPEGRERAEQGQIDPARGPVGVSAVGAFCLDVEAVVLPVHTTIEPDIPTVGSTVRGRSLPTCQAVPGLSILEVPGRLALPIAGDTQEELTAIEVQIA